MKVNLNKLVVVQNLKLANKKLVSKLFVHCDNRHVFLCHCDNLYVGRTSQRLQDKICQHVTQIIRTGLIPNSRNIFTRFGKFSTQVMFSKLAIG